MKFHQITTKDPVTDSNLLRGSLPVADGSGSIVSAHNTTGSVLSPRGTTAERPIVTDAGFRMNTSINALEFWNGTAWIQLQDAVDTRWYRPSPDVVLSNPPAIPDPTKIYYLYLPGGIWTGKNGQFATWDSITLSWVYQMPKVGWAFYNRLGGSLAVGLHVCTTVFGTEAVWARIPLVSELPAPTPGLVQFFSLGEFPIPGSMSSIYLATSTQKLYFWDTNILDYTPIP